MDAEARAAVARALSQAQQDHFRHLAHRRIVAQPPGSRALFLAPHPDDNVLGCGGTMVRLVRSGVPVTLAYLTDGGGAAATPEARPAMIQRRAAEARAVAARLGAPPPRLLGFDELQFTAPGREQEELAAIVGLLDELRPDAVFVPYLWDQHADHRYSNHLLARALQRTGLRPVVYGYEVWSFAPPGLVVDVTDVFDEKLALLSLYASQLELFDYLGFTQQVGHLHAGLGPPGARFCEVFCPFRADAYVDLVLGLDLASPVSRETIVLLTPPTTAP